MLRLPMSRRVAGLASAAVLGLLAGLPLAVQPGPGTPGLASPRALAATAGAATLARGWARVFMSGTLTSVSPARSVSLAINGPGTAHSYEGGTAWRSRPLSGTHRVRLLPLTVITDGTARPVPVELLRTGDRATVWGAMRPDGAIMAVAMMVSTPRPAARPAARAAGPAGRVTGVVASRSPAMLDLVTDTGTRREVLVTATTQVRIADGAAAAPVIVPFDVVTVDGAVNSDGSLVAAHVRVDFLAAQSAQISGPIESVHGDVGGLLVAGTMVCASARTYFVHGAARLWIAQVKAGRPVTVYGRPIIADGTPVGLAARVIVVR